MKFLILLTFVISVGRISEIFADGHETCDSEHGCEDEYNNVWTEDHYPNQKEDSDTRQKSNKIQVDDSILEYFKANGVSMKKLEIALLLNHLDQGGDGKVGQEDLEAVQEMQGPEAVMSIVQSVVKSFDRLDTNDDGKLTGDELPTFESGEDDDSSESVTIAQYLIILSRLYKSIAEALEPFQGLGFLSPFEMKTVIARSVTVFQDKDLDGSGGLNMAEYLAQVDRPDNPRSQMMDQEQKEKIFNMIDKDGDGEISYSEFQAVIPKGPPTMPTPKDMEGIFQAADKDGDGFWSREEFRDHLRSMVLKTGAPEPKEVEIVEAFSHLDVNEDGQVSKEEMHGIGKQIEKIQEEKAAAGFTEMDLDGDGVLTRTEMLTMAQAMEEKAGQKVDVDTLMKMMDKNENGMIELEEVKEMIQRMIPQTGRH